VEGKKIFMELVVKSLDGLEEHAFGSAIFVQPKKMISFDKAYRLFGRESDATQGSILDMIRATKQAAQAKL
jgi:hypothetical protein